jgi:hypothetical protein
MRTNKQTVMNIDTMVAVWEDYPAIKDFFDYDKVRANYKTMINENENYDMLKNKGLFTVGEDWCIIIYFKNDGEFSDDEIIQSNIDEIIKFFGKEQW